MSTLCEVTVESINEVLNSFSFIVAESVRVDCLCIWNTVESPFIRDLSNWVEWWKETVLFCTVAWWCTWSEWFACLTSVRKSTCSLTVNNVWCDCKDRCCWFRISVCVSLLDHCDECLEEVNTDLVSSVVIVTILREVAFDIEVNNDAVFVTDCLNLSILDSWEWVDYVWEACDTCSKCSSYVCIDKSHFSCFIVVLVVHVLDEVKCIYIESSEPVHHYEVLLHNFIVVEVFRSDWLVLRSYLCEWLFINTAVDSVKEALSEVSSCAEELHFLTCLCSWYAAADWVVVAPNRLHNIIVFVLDRRCCDWDVWSVLLECFREVLRIENCEVRFWWRSHVFECVEETEVVLCYHVTTVNADTTNFECSPNRVTWEEFVVWRNSCELNHSELHCHVVDKFLSFLFCDCACFEVTLDVDVEECWYTAYWHSCTVLCLDSCEVTEVEPLNSFLSVLSRLWNIVAVDLSHLLHALESLDLVWEFFSETDNVICHCTVACVSLVVFLFLDEEVDTVKSNPSVVAYDTATAVCIRKTCDNVALTGSTDLRCVSIKYTLVMCLVVFVEDLVELRVYLVAVAFSSLLRHLDAAVRHERSL